MKARPRAPFLARASTFLLAASLGMGQGGSLLQSVRAAPEVAGRWGQASLLLTPVDDPTLYIISGKSYVAGQTLTSTPTTDSSISLSLHSPIADLASPPWIESTSSPSGPLSAYGSALALSSTTALFFGGDATGDPTEVVQSGNDSSWLLSYPTSGSQNWTHEAAAWAGQPMRRQQAYAASATNGTVSRGWIYGGLRSDGSGVGFNELWEVRLGVGSAGLVSGGVWQQSLARVAASAPPAMWDGQAVLVPSSTTGGLPSIYLIGGVQIVDGVTSLASMSSLWVFTPSDSLGSGEWSQLSVADAPEPRRGHVGVEVGDGKIWIQGGRTLDGSAVRSDAAVLDTRTRTWTMAAVGAAVWGHSAALIGETVVMAFGYGLNAPASASLTVYAPGNDTFLTAYYPSYEVIIANPKASRSSSPSSTALVAGTTLASVETSEITYVSSALVTEASTTAWVAVTTSTSLSIVQQTMGATASAQAPHPSSSSTSTAAPWVAPGGPSSSSSSDSSSTSDSDPSTTDSNDSSSDSQPSSKAVVAGAVVGSLLGALALVGAGLLVARRRQQRRNARGPYAYPALTTGRRRGGGYGGGEGSGGLMTGAGAAKSSEEYNLEKPLPALRRSEETARTPVVGFLAAIGLGKGGRGTPKQQEKGRFAMLEDEESEAWDSLNSRQRGGEEGNHHKAVMRWTTFGDEEDEMEEKASGRGGTGVWDGYDFGGEGGMGKAGRAMSESVKSGRSFLTNALGGFVPLSASEEDEERRLDAIPLGAAAAAAGLTPINEDYEDDRELDMDAQLSSNDHATTETTGTRSTGTHHTSSTGPTSSGASSGNLSRLNSRNTPTRPFSPATSLYGSTFNSPSSSATIGLSPSPTKRHAPALAAVPGGGGGMSRSSSANSNLLDRSRSNSSWWGRLARRPSLADEPTSTASLGIRDPAPAPRMGVMEAIEEKSPLPSASSPDPPQLALASDDPFADPSPSSSFHAVPPSNSNSLNLNLHHLTHPDEQGRLSSRALGLAHNRSISSAHSQATATSSVLEERMRGMDVVQRVRTGSAGGASAVSGEAEGEGEGTPRMGGGGGGGGGFGRLPEREEEEEIEEERVIKARRESLATQQQGRLVFAGSAAGSIRTTSPEPLLRSPTSPSSRLFGPRPPPPSLSLSIPTTTASTRPPAAPTTAGSAGVRAIVQRFEERSSPSLSSSSSSPATVFLKSNSMSSLLTSPTKAVARERTRRSTLAGGGAAGEGRRKVEHGLARKPVLYVANPDA